MSATGRLRRGWTYYRRYTRRRTGIHAAATAALTGFGLLAYYVRWFVVVAIVAYFVPPVYLYLTGDDLAEHETPVTTSRERTTPASADDPARIARDTGAADGDTDFDGIDADADADSDDGDTDTDSDDGDTDTDSDSDG